MREEAILAAIYATTLGLCVSLVSFAARQGEVNKKKEITIGAATWLIASVLIFVFLRTLL